MDKAQERETFLRTEYEFLAKAYEVHFTHFMGVFYFWVAVIGAPTTASAISISNIFSPGAVWFGAGLLGCFLTAKLYDLRYSQFRYIVKMNELRARFWQFFDIEKHESVEMLGKNANLEEIARKDFGARMAWIMSIFNGGVIAGGVLLWSLFGSQYVNIAIASAIGLLTAFTNIYLYYGMVVWKICKLLPQPKAEAASRG